MNVRDGGRGLVLFLVSLLTLLTFVADALTFHQNLCIWFFYHCRTNLFLNPLEEDEEYRHGEQNGQGTHKHTADYGDTDGTVAVCTGTE